MYCIACYDRESIITGRIRSHTTNLNERLEIVDTTIQLKDFELQEGGQPLGINLPSTLSIQIHNTHLSGCPLAATCVVRMVVEVIQPL